jgi:hypothetical protein
MKKGTMRETTITGKKVEEVQINVTSIELINGLAKVFGVSPAVQNDETDCKWRCEGNKLERYINKSYHGSPNWVLVDTIDNTVKVEAYQCLIKLKKLLELEEVYG